MKRLFHLVTIVLLSSQLGIVVVVRSELTGDDLDLFDVVEDVKQNFYELLEVPQNATTADIRKAYRKLSLQYHPDRNADPDAAEVFRKIAAVADVLRDEKKRAKYHEVLEYGIPDWARSMYYRYYRKARKMGSTEMSVMMAIIVSVAQTLWMWASYWEKKFTIESNVNEAIKRKKQRSTNAKKNKAAEEGIQQIRQELMAQIHPPTWTDIWFIRLPVALFHATLALPGWIADKMAKKEEPVDDADSDEDVDERPVKPKRTPRSSREPLVKAAQVVNGLAPPPVVGSRSPGGGGGGGDDAAAAAKLAPKRPVKEGAWSDNEVATLIRLLKKFPVGCVDRWEKIADALNRSEADVLERVKSMRSTKANVIPEHQNSNKSLWVEGEISTKDLEDEEEDGRGDRDEGDDDDEDAEPESDPTAWTSAQQKQLEMAMVAFPKWTEGRWDLIADRVDGKSKKACVARVRWLIENKKKKSSGPASAAMNKDVASGHDD